MGVVVFLLWKALVSRHDTRMHYHIYFRVTKWNPNYTRECSKYLLHSLTILASARRPTAYVIFALIHRERLVARACRPTCRRHDDGRWYRDGGRPTISVGLNISRPIGRFFFWRGLIHFWWRGINPLSPPPSHLGYGPASRGLHEWVSEWVGGCMVTGGLTSLLHVHKYHGAMVRRPGGRSVHAPPGAYRPRPW